MFWQRGHRPIREEGSVPHPSGWDGFRDVVFGYPENNMDASVDLAIPESSNLSVGSTPSARARDWKTCVLNIAVVSIILLYCFSVLLG
jgi:hypothetical protein